MHGLSLSPQPEGWGYSPAVSMKNRVITPPFMAEIISMITNAALAVTSKIVSPDEFLIFLSECNLFVMFLLGVDVCSHLVKHRFTHRNCEIFICPFKLIVYDFLLIYPES